MFLITFFYFLRGYRPAIINPILSLKNGSAVKKNQAEFCDIFFFSLYDTFNMHIHPDPNNTDKIHTRGLENCNQPWFFLYDKYKCAFLFRSEYVKKNLVHKNVDLLFEKKTYLGLVLMPEKLKSCASFVPNGGFGDSEPLASGAAFPRITFSWISDPTETDWQKYTNILNIRQAYKQTARQMDKKQNRRKAPLLKNAKFW